MNFSTIFSQNDFILTIYREKPYYYDFHFMSGFTGLKAEM